jgi:RNA polymerase sigma-70 factor (ECF subfamily)
MVYPAEKWLRKKRLLNLFAGQVVQSIEPTSDQESTARVEHARNNDVELVRRAAGGDVAAYEELYRQHVGRVFGLCLRMTRDRGEAEEMVQDVFVRVWDKLGSFRGNSAFSTWLHRVAVNTVVENLRVKARWRERHDAAADPEDEADSGFASLAGADIDLERAIMRLPVQARLVFVLHDVEGNKHREIAALTGLAVGTCKAHLHRARQLLREMLGDEAREVVR